MTAATHAAAERRLQREAWASLYVMTLDACGAGKA